MGTRQADAPQLFTFRPMDSVNAVTSGRTLTVEIGKVAAQANGAALMRYGDTVVLSTATASEKPSIASREWIEDNTKVTIPANKRNYRKQKA